jgi:hypothetical protein
MMLSTSLRNMFQQQPACVWVAKARFGPVAIERHETSSTTIVVVSKSWQFTTSLKIPQQAVGDSAKMSVQCLLIAAVLNFKRLASAKSPLSALDYWKKRLRNTIWQPLCANQGTKIKLVSVSLQIG